MDLRGFTQRMCRAKEITTADFMLKGFFLPVLEVAKKYHTSEGVRLNNLVGDAFSFSGRIKSLIALARELREIFDRYTGQMKDHEGMLNEGEEARARGERYRRERNAIIRERTGIDHSIRGIEQELKLKEFLNPIHLVKIQQEDFNIKFSFYQQQLAALPQRIEAEEDKEKKRDLVDMKKNLMALQEGINEHKRELMESINSIGHEELNKIFRLVCAQERDELNRLRRLLRESYDKESALNEAYEPETLTGQEREIEYGLFISYGDAAENIGFEDPFWGQMSVAIAEKLNEAARGTERSPDIRKKMGVLLRNARRAKGVPSLTYPFNVFIDKSYGLSFRSDLSNMVDKALQNRDQEQAREILDAATSLFMNDISKGKRGFGDTGWETLTYFNDIYNLGEALSGEALQAYLREVSPHQYSFDKEVKTTELHPEIQQRFFFPSPVLRFTICTEKEGEQLHFDLFRYEGELVFKGFETSQATVVYEIVRTNSPFYLLLERHHLGEWYRQAREKTEQARAAHG